MNKYGFDEEDWTAAKEEMRQLLTERAKMRSTIPYSEVVDAIEAIRFEPISTPFHRMLGEISSEEDAAGRGMLTVIVTHKGGDMEPGPGFFEMAANLGRDVSDKQACWVQELKDVWRYWSGTRD